MGTHDTALTAFIFLALTLIIIRPLRLVGFTYALTRDAGLLFCQCTFGVRIPVVLNITHQRFSAVLRRFRHARKGATAVEFALVAAPFFFLLFAIVEITLIFFTSTALEHAAMEVARKVRTGEFQGAGSSGGDFVNQVCAKMSGLVPCNGNVSVDVRTFVDFGDITTNTPIDQNGNLASGSFQFDPGNAGDIVLVRVFYSWQLNTPMIGTVFSNLAGNKRLIVASTAFRNEPFGSN